MYFRKSEVANDVFCRTRGGFCQPAMSNDLLIKGVGFENDKRCQELFHRTLRKTLKKEKEITVTKSFNEIAVVSESVSPSSRQVQTVNKAETQKEESNIERSTSGKEEEKQINGNSYMSALTSLKERRTRGSIIRRPQSGFGLLRNRAEPKCYSLYEKSEDKDKDSSESDLYIKHIEAPIRRRGTGTTKLIPQTPSAADKLKLTFEKPNGSDTEKETKTQSRSDETCEKGQRLDRASSATVREKKSVEIYGKGYTFGAARKLKALNCALSRRNQSVDQTLDDEDYQEIDFEYLLRLKTMSRLSRMCDASAIEAVAKENSVKTETFLPPVHGSKWTLKDRYMAELSFNPPTPVLREYTRISQARVVDFSNAALGSQVYIL